MAMTPAFAATCPTIGGLSGDRACHRRDVYDDTATAPDQVRACELRHEEGNVEFAGYGRPPVIGREIGHRTEVLYGRVIADDVERAVRGSGILNHLPRLFGVGEIDRRDASHLTAGATY